MVLLFAYLGVIKMFIIKTITFTQRPLKLLLERSKNVLCLGTHFQKLPKKIFFRNGFLNVIVKATHALLS